MKIRNGFVSNSSASSFTIYGWKKKDLFSYLDKLNLSGENFEDFGFIYKMEKRIKELWNGDPSDIVIAETSYGDEIIGIGTRDSEIDHSIPDGEYWEDFEFDAPSTDYQNKLKKMAEDLDLPKPSLYQETFFDG